MVLKRATGLQIAVRWLASPLWESSKATIIEEMTTPRRYPDGDGLYLKVSPSGEKSWVLRLQVNGTRHDIGLGDARYVPVRTARLEGAALSLPTYMVPKNCADLAPLNSQRQDCRNRAYV